MRVIGLGTDIIEVKRMEQFAQKPGALERIFTPQEIAYCQARKNVYQHLAVRFAAKEAVYKALPFGGVAFKNIQVINLENGRPEVHIADERFTDLSVLLTLSHTEQYATATALVQQ